MNNESKYTDNAKKPRPIEVAVCPECEKRTLHYIDTAQCMICSIDTHNEENTTNFDE